MSDAPYPSARELGRAVFTAWLARRMTILKDAHMKLDPPPDCVCMRCGQRHRRVGVDGDVPTAPRFDRYSEIRYLLHFRRGKTIHVVCARKRGSPFIISQACWRALAETADTMIEISDLLRL